MSRPQSHILHNLRGRNASRRPIGVMQTVLRLPQVIDNRCRYPTVPAGGIEVIRPRRTGGPWGIQSKSSKTGPATVSSGHRPIRHTLSGSRWERGRRVAAAIVGYSALLAVGALALLVWGPLRGEPAIETPCSRNGGCSQCSACSGARRNWAPVSVHHRGNTGIIVLDAVPLVIGLVFLGPDLLVVGCVVSEMVVFATVHRQPLIKVFFNASSTGFAVAVAAVVFREFLGGQSPVSWRGWAPSSPPCAARN